MPAKTEQLQERVTLDMTLAPEQPADSGTIEAKVKAFQVTSEEEYTAASNMIQIAASNIAKAEAFFEGTPDNPGIKVLAHRAHAAICEKIRTITAPWRSVRANLEPKMKSYRKRIDDERRAAELKLQQEQAEAARLAQVEADAIRLKAEHEAAELRKAGDLRAAKEAQANAAQQAQAVVEEAAAMNEVGVILPDVRPVDGPGEARIWRGVVDDIKETCRAIGAGEVPLMFTLPKRGGGEEEVPIVEISQKVIDYLAKRHGRADIGVNGCHGERELSLRFSKSAHPELDRAQADTEGW